MIESKLIKKLRELGFNVENSACGGITIGSTYDCDNPITPGVNQRLILGSLENIESITYALSPVTLIEDITMKTTTQCFAFEGIRQSLKPQYEFVPGSVSVGYNHTVNFLVFEISQDQKDNLEKMALDSLFAVIENRNSVGNADSIFEVFGIGVGMEVISNIRINSDQETGGAFSIGLQTPEAEGKEPKMPQSWFITDYATTLAAVNSLLTPA